MNNDNVRSDDELREVRREPRKRHDLERAIFDAGMRLNSFFPSTHVWGIPTCDDARCCARDLDDVVNKVIAPLLQAFAVEHAKLHIDSSSLLTALRAEMLVACERLEQEADRMQRDEHHRSSSR